MEKLLEIMCYNPRKRFNIDSGCDFAVFEINNKYKVNPDEFVSKGRATPFAGREVYGKCVLTVHNSKVVYKEI